MRLFLVVALLCACGGEEGEESTQETPAAEPERAGPSAASAGERERAENDEAAESPAAAAERLAAAASEANGAPGAQGAAEGLQALAEAMRAGSNPEGNTPCERAYNGMIAMVAALGKAQNDTAPSGAPPRDEFIPACEQLPETAQRCMTVDYGMAHQEECMRVMQSDELAGFTQRFRPGR
ncbi:MAG: hypothetical protein AAF645_13140 [Myxococcota bacterium]